MGTKSIDRKVLKKQIIERRKDNKSDGEIYTELSQQYYNKKVVALSITGTPRQEVLEKYKILNAVLVGLLCLSLLSIVTMIFFKSLNGNVADLLLLFIVPGYDVLFIIGVLNYEPMIYKLCGLLTFLGFFQIALKSTSGWEIILNLFYTITVVALSLYLSSKLFPNYKPSKLKKDSNGDYNLDYFQS